MTPDEAHVAFAKLMLKVGVPGPRMKKNDIQPPLDDGPETDCWTHAWRYAVEHGGRYIEGVCRRPGRPNIATHAWVEMDGPFGPCIVETTAGYEHAYGHMGVRINMESETVQKAEFEGVRYSVIQLVLAADVPPAKALAMVTVK